jgi:hypothetical protein
MSKGSVWRIWDFHTHTPCSVLQNGFSDPSSESTWEEYVKELSISAKNNNISALGITDYFTFEGFLKLSQYIDNIDNEYTQHLRSLFLFPNLEFRIIPSTQKDKPVNLHLLFNPDILDEIEPKVLSQLTFSYKNGHYSCMKSELIRLGKEYVGHEIDDKRAFKEGVLQANINLIDIKKTLKKNEKIRSNCLIAVSNSSRDGASGIRYSGLAATREEIYYCADLIFSGNPKDREYFLGYGVDSIEEIIRKYGNLKPCVTGSDAHRLSELGVVPHNRYCWIKADLCWDGLKQILFEPEHRVKIQEDSPEHPKSSFSINSFFIAIPSPK